MIAGFVVPNLPSMTDHVPETEHTTAPAAPVPSVPADAVVNTAVTPSPAASEGDSRRGSRGGRRPRKRRAGAAEGSPAPREGAPTAQRAPRPVPPLLQKLAELYPHLFGAEFRPLKRGIFQDLQAAHPDLFEREALKVALGLHTRSTRYLQSVASGQPRHDLQGQPVEDMAPEHVHHALLEVYRRKQGRAGAEDLRPKLINRIIHTFEKSGLDREAYAERVITRDAAANALLDEAFAEMAARQARDEALLRAFEASGQTLEAFADMYGMVPRTVGQVIERARRQRATAATTPAAS